MLQRIQPSTILYVSRDSLMHSIVTLVKPLRLSADTMGVEYIQWVFCIELTQPPVHNVTGAQQSWIPRRLRNTHFGTAGLQWSEVAPEI